LVAVISEVSSEETTDTLPAWDKADCAFEDVKETLLGLLKMLELLSIRLLLGLVQAVA